MGASRRKMIKVNSEIMQKAPIFSGTFKYFKKSYFWERKWIAATLQVNLKMYSIAAVVFRDHS